MVQTPGAECEGVPLLRRHQDLPPPGGVHLALAAGRRVHGLRHLLPVVVEVGEVGFPGVNTGVDAEADPPGPGLRDSEDACNETK